MSTTDPTTRRLGTWTMAAAIAAGVIAWLVGETSPVWVAAKGVPVVTQGRHHVGPTTATVEAALIATAARLHGVFGVVLGLALGAAGGPGRGWRALAGALVGASLGLVAGLVGAYVGIPLFIGFESVSKDLTHSLLLHGGTWGAIGVAAAIGWGVGAAGGKGQFLQAVLGGAIGALLGAAAFELVGAVFFVSAATDGPISTTPASRLLARLLVATFTAVGIVAAAGMRPRAKRAE
jgi:hypothetical protein